MVSSLYCLVDIVIGSYVYILNFYFGFYFLDRYIDGSE